MIFGKCPHCKATLSKPKVEAVTITQGDGATWKGVNYLCPACNAVLGVSVDPIALKDELVKEMRGLLGR